MMDSGQASKSIGDQTLRLRLPTELKWRIDYFAKKNHQTVSAATRMLLLKGLGEMRHAEEAEWRRHTVANDTEATPAPVPKPAAPSPAPTAEPPLTCPTCGESTVPITEGPIWMINQIKRTATCNNCGTAISY